MSNIRNFTFKSNTVQGVISNSHTVASVMYDTTLVFGGEEESAETVFEVYPECLPCQNSNNHNTNRYLQPRIGAKKTVYTIPNPLKISGMANFFIRINGSNTGNIDITRTNKGTDFVYKIENLGYGYMRKIGYNTWPGGDGSTSSSSITFTPSRDTSLAKTINIYQGVDEDHTVFLRGLFLSKVIRIPASGIVNGYLKLLFFPYTFDSHYYYDDINCGVVDASNVGGKDGDNNLVRNPYITRTTASNLSNNVFLDTFLPTRETAYQFNLRYDVGRNTTGAYKSAFVGFSIYLSMSQGQLDGVFIHFIQEYESNYRIYYGDVPPDPKIWEAYNDTPTENLRYHYIFQTASSEIVTSTKTIVADSGSNNAYRQNVLCVPSNTYSITSSNSQTPSLLASSYYWGDQSYDIYQLTSSITYTVNVL